MGKPLTFQRVFDGDEALDSKLDTEAILTAQFVHGARAFCNTPLRPEIKPGYRYFLTFMLEERAPAPTAPGGEG